VPAARASQIQHLYAGRALSYKSPSAVSVSEQVVVVDVVSTSYRAHAVASTPFVSPGVRWCVFFWGLRVKVRKVRKDKEGKDGMKVRRLEGKKKGIYKIVSR